MSFWSSLVGGGSGALSATGKTGVGSKINWGNVAGTALNAYGAYKGSKPPATSGGGNLFQGGTGNFGDGGGSGGLFSGGEGNFGGNTPDSSAWSRMLGTVGDYFKGSGGTGAGGGSIWSSLLAGLGGAAEAKLDEGTARELGKQKRKSLDFEASLMDYYGQKDKVRKRAALDTYGQFSTMDRWAPGAKAAPPVDMPTRPGY